MKIKVLLLVLSLCCVFGGNAQNKRKDWAQFYRYEAKNDSLERKPSVVFMGNSITDFWAKTRPEFFAKYNIAGRGISGQVSSQMLVRFQNDVVALKPKAVVILSGTNDIAQNNGIISLEHIVQNIVSMCQIAKYNGIQPVIASVLPCAIFSWKKELKPAEEIKKLNAMLKKYAKKNKIPYVDYYSALTDEQGGLPETYSGDGCHPNEAGYAIMEGVVLKTINKYVKK